MRLVLNSVLTSNAKLNMSSRSSSDQNAISLYENERKNCLIHLNPWKSMENQNIMP